MSRISKQVTFPGASGQMLAARLDVPAAGSPRAFALFAHCFTCSKDTKATTFIADALADAGIATLRFDFTGLGGSEGEFANTGFSSNVQDLVAAAQWLEREHVAPALLVGHSLGGTAVLAAAALIPSATAVVTINAPAEPAHVLKQIGDHAADIRERGEAEVELAGRRFRIRREFLDDVAAQAVTAAVAQLGRALLIMHAPADTIVGIDNATALFVAARHPKSFVSLDDADHLLTRREDARYAAGVLAAWAGRYLPEVAAKPAAAPADSLPPAPQNDVVVTETRNGKFQQRVTMGAHVLLVDEPESVGGNATGPTPYDLLLAALGACTAMTLRLYADQKKLVLDRVSVTLRHDKVHAADCADCATREGRIDRIERIVHLEGQLDHAARARLLEIADKCPVHRTLNSEAWIPTSLG